MTETDRHSSPSRPVTIWDYKPWWCQPWSIVLTGVTLIGGSWLVLHTLWVTILVAIPVLAWMGFFVLLYPQLIQQSGLLENYANSADPDDC